MLCIWQIFVGYDQLSQIQARYNQIKATDSRIRVRACSYKQFKRSGTSKLRCIWQIRVSYEQLSQI